MSCWTKEELENMLEDVVNELDLSESAIAGTWPEWNSTSRYLCDWFLIKKIGRFNS
jgi:hypothetical protein